MRFIIDKEQRAIYQKFTGKLTFERWLESAKSIWDHPDYRNNMRGIIDVAQAEIKMSTADIKNLVTLLVEDSSGKATKAETVIIVSEPFAAALATLFSEGIKEQIPVNISVAEQDAFYFLRIDSSIKNRLEKEPSDVVKFRD